MCNKFKPIYLPPGKFRRNVKSFLCTSFSFFSLQNYHDCFLYKSQVHTTDHMHISTIEEMNLRTDDFFWGLALSNARLASSYSTSKQVRLKCISCKKVVSFEVRLVQIVQIFITPTNMISSGSKWGERSQDDHFPFMSKPSCTPFDDNSFYTGDPIHSQNRDLYHWNSSRPVWTHQK